MDGSSLTHSEGLGKMIQPAEEKPEEARKQCDLHHRTQEVVASAVSETAGNNEAKRRKLSGK